MGNDKVLSKMREQIAELMKTLVEFSDKDVQPAASDCEKLQTQLWKLQDNLAVFKYQKTNQEVSPSFNIHARVSEEIKPEIKVEVPEIKKPEAPKPVIEVPATPPPAKTTSGKAHMPIMVGVNDKFRFINELFSQNPAEFNIAIEQLSSLKTWNESELYLNSLKALYVWKEQQDVVKHLYSIVRRRFE